MSCCLVESPRASFHARPNVPRTGETQNGWSECSRPANQATASRRQTPLSRVWWAPFSRWMVLRSRCEVICYPFRCCDGLGHGWRRLGVSGRRRWRSRTFAVGGGLAALVWRRGRDGVALEDQPSDVLGDLGNDGVPEGPKSV